MKDSEILSGNFFEFEIPKNKKYLLKYFDTEIQNIFLKYYMCFGTINNFVDHTGYFCSDRFLFKMQKKYIKLVQTYDKAKSALTEEGMRVVELLELGKMPLTKLPDF